jgi:hypothetical protein
MLNQPEVGVTPALNVIRFSPRPASVGLSLRDRMEIAALQGKLQHFGYDRMVIHDRISCDPPEVDCFLSIYRNGEAWARYGLARCGSTILAWCSVTSADIGRFASMGEALEAVFPMSPGAAGPRGGAEVIRAFC